MKRLSLEWFLKNKSFLPRDKNVLLPYELALVCSKNPAAKAAFDCPGSDFAYNRRDKSKLEYTVFDRILVTLFLLKNKRIPAGVVDFAWISALLAAVFSIIKVSKTKRSIKKALSSKSKTPVDLYLEPVTQIVKGNLRFTQEVLDVPNLPKIRPGARSAPERSLSYDYSVLFYDDQERSPANKLIRYKTNTIKLKNRELKTLKFY